MNKHFWIALPRGIAARWKVEQLTASEALRNVSGFEKIVGPYRNAAEAAEAEEKAESVRRSQMSRYFRVENFTHGRGR